MIGRKKCELTDELHLEDGVADLQILPQVSQESQLRGMVNLY
jgi:hypothetical protein